MPKYLSGRVKVRPQAELTEDRYQYIGLDQVEPNLGTPPETQAIPPGQQYQVVSIENRPGERFWVPIGGGVIPGAVTIRDEGIVIPSTDANPNLGINSITNINFVGSAVTVIGNIKDNGHPGIAVTVTVAPVGNDHEIQYNNRDLITGIGSFTGAHLFVYNNDTAGIASVGIGTTDPTNTLHVVGDIRLTGTIYDTDNDEGSQNDILVKNDSGGVQWTAQNAVNSGAGGDVGQVQFHGATGLVDGADNVYFDDTNDRLGIGSAIPRTLLDVVGVASFSRLEVAGITTTYGLLDINAGGQANSFKVEDLTQGRVTYAGVDGELTDSANLTFDGNGLTVGYATITKLKVTGVGTIGNIEIGGDDDNVITTQIGNLKLDSYAGTVVSNDPFNIIDTSQANNFNTGSLINSGGAVIKKNLNVGGALSHYGPAPTDPVSVAATISGAGGITTTGGHLYVGGDLFIRDNLTYLSAAFAQLYVSPGVSTFVGVASAMDDAYFNGSGADGSKVVHWDSSEDQLSFPDSSVLSFGDGVAGELSENGDLKIYHTGTDSYIENETGYLVLNSEHFKLETNLGEKVLGANVGSGVSLYYDDGLRFQTSGMGVTVTGITSTTYIWSTGISTFAGKAHFHNLSNANKDIEWQPSNDRLAFYDSVKATFGNEADLEIAHTGSNVEIKNITGWMNFYAGGEGFSVGNGNFTKNLIKADNDADVKLYWAGASDAGEKLATTAEGVKISGTLDLTGALKDKDSGAGISGQILQSTGTAVDWVDASDLTTVNANKVGVGSTNPSLTSHFRTTGIGTYYMTFVEQHNPYDDRKNEYVYSNSNIVFDSLQNRLGIGTTAPESRLHAVTYDGHNAIRVESSGAANRAGIEFYRQSSAGFGKGAAAIWTYSDLTTSNGKLLFGTANNAQLATQTPKMVIDADGKVGIGTTIPKQLLDVRSNAAFGPEYVSGTHANSIGVATVRGHHVNSTGDFARLYFSNSKSAGSNNIPTASIRGERVGQNYKTELTFYTNDSNTASGNGDGDERLRISSAGAVQVKGGANGHLQIDGNGEFELFQQNTSLTMTNSSKIGMDFGTHDDYPTETLARIRSSHNGSGGNAVSRPLSFFIGTSEKLRITSDGHVGIGTTYPNNPLTMNDDIKLNTSILAVGIVTANHYYGTFKGDIDPGVSITNASNVAITNDTGGSGTHYIHFGSATTGFDGVEVDSGRNPDNQSTQTGLVYLNGKMGVGNDIPDSFDAEADRLVVGSGVGDQGITIYSGSNTGDHGSIFFADGTTGDAPVRGQIRYEHNTELMSFVVNNATRLKINKDDNINPGSHEVQDLGESNSNRWNAVWAKEFRGGTFYGTIDSNVTVPNADKVKTVKWTSEDTPEPTQYLTFVNSNNDSATVEEIKTGAGITFNPTNDYLYLDGSLYLKGDGDVSDGDIHSWGGQDGNFAIFNEGSGNLSLSVKNSSNVTVSGIVSFTSEGGNNDAAKKTYFDSNVFPRKTGTYNLGKSGNVDCADGHASAPACWNNVYACSYYGDGSNLTCVGGATAWQPDSHENLKAGTDAGSALDNDTCYNIFVGHDAGKCMDGNNGHACNGGGQSNVFIGCEAGINVKDLCDTVAIGRNAGHNYTSTTVVGGNVCFGRHIFIGVNAGHGQENAATGHCNVAIGINALTCTTNGNYNVTLGRNSGKCVTTGNNNILIGGCAGHCIENGDNNVVLGACAGRRVYGSTGCHSCNNVFLGFCALGCGSYVSRTNCSVAIGYNVRLPIENEVGRSTGDANKQLVIGNGNNTESHWIVGDKDRNVGIGTTLPNSDSQVADNNRILAVAGIVTAVKLYGDGSCLTNIGTGDNNAVTNANNVKIDLTKTAETFSYKVPFIRDDTSDLSYQAFYAQDGTGAGIGITYSPSSRNFYNSASIVAGAPGHNGGTIGIGTHDGYGNANLMFNHVDGRPDRNGSSARIEVNVDSTKNPAMSFELKANTTKEQATSLVTVMQMLVNDDTNEDNSTTSALVPGTNGGSDLGSDTSYDGRQTKYWDRAFVNEYYGTFKGTIDGTATALSLNATTEDVFSIASNVLGSDDPGGDRVVFWDDNADRGGGQQGKLRFLTIGSGLTLDDTTLKADAGGDGGVTDVQINYSSRANTCTEPITITGTGTKTINIPNTSNADGKKWVQNSQPADANVCDGDVWYDTSASGSGGSGNIGGNTPIGGIIMYSGTQSQLNGITNWKICDGANGTPNLTDKFIIAGHVWDATSNEWKTAVTGSNTQSGGHKNSVVVAHDHGNGSLALSSNGSHTHPYTDPTIGLYPHMKTDSHGTTVEYPTTNGGTTGGNGGHSHTVSGSTGTRGINTSGNNNNDQTGTNKNLPPYFSLAYIMRIA